MFKKTQKVFERNYFPLFDSTKALLRPHSVEEVFVCVHACVWGGVGGAIPEEKKVHPPPLN